MRIHVKLVLTTIAAAIVLAALVGTAAANRLEVSEPALWYQTFPSLHFNGGGFVIACPVTLEGSFHSRTLSKVRGQLIGFLKKVTVGTCTEGHARALTETLPWHVTYESFSGRLPEIREIHLLLLGAKFAIEHGLGVICLATTSSTSPAEGWVTREAGGNVTSLRVNEALQIPTTGTFCPFAEGSFSGSSEVFAGAAGSTARLRVTLVQ